MIDDKQLAELEIVARQTFSHPSWDKFMFQLIAEIRKLRKIALAARDVIKFAEPEWCDDVDRGDADIALAEALKEWESP